MLGYDQFRVAHIKRVVDRRVYGFGAIMILRNFTYATLSLLALAVPAQAASPYDIDECSSGEADRVIAGCTRVIQDPQETRQQRTNAYYNRGLAYRNKKDFDRAIADYTEAIKLDPSNVMAYNNRGVAFHNKRDFDHAIADYSTAIKLAPKDPHAFNNRCWSRTIAGHELEQALSDCNAALQRLPNNFDTLENRGLTNIKLGRFDAAIADYSAALRQNPKTATSLYGRGLAKLRKGDTAGGNADIVAAKTIQSDIADEFARYGVK